MDTSESDALPLSKNINSINNSNQDEATTIDDLGLPKSQIFKIFKDAVRKFSNILESRLIDHTVLS